MLLPSDFKVWVYKEPTDMRKAINGLSQLVVEKWSDNPQSGALYVFYNRARDRIKVLYWHYNGFCLLHKRLESGRFKLPTTSDNHFELSEHQLYRLLEGLHFLNKSEKVYDVFF